MCQRHMINNLTCETNCNPLVTLLLPNYLVTLSVAIYHTADCYISFIYNMSAALKLKKNKNHIAILIGGLISSVSNM